MYESVKDSIKVPIDIVETSKIKQQEFEKYIEIYSEELITSTELNEMKKNQ